MSPLRILIKIHRQHLPYNDRRKFNDCLHGQRTERAIIYLILLKHHGEEPTHQDIIDSEAYVLPSSTLKTMANEGMLTIQEHGRVQGRIIHSFTLTDKGKALAEKIESSLTDLIQSTQSQPA